MFAIHPSLHPFRAARPTDWRKKEGASQRGGEQGARKGSACADGRAGLRTADVVVVAVVNRPWPEQEEKKTITAPPPPPHYTTRDLFAKGACNACFRYIGRRGTRRSGRRRRRRNLNEREKEILFRRSEEAQVHYSRRAGHFMSVFRQTPPSPSLPSVLLPLTLLLFYTSSHFWPKGRQTDIRHDS